MTMDVVGLYPSIPNAEGIGTVVDMAMELKDQRTLLGVPLSVLRELLVYVLDNNY